MATDPDHRSGDPPSDPIGQPKPSSSQGSSILHPLRSAKTPDQPFDDATFGGATFGGEQLADDDKTAPVNLDTSEIAAVETDLVMHADTTEDATDDGAGNGADAGAGANRGGEPPITIGRYRLIRRLGAGGMGAVYEAEHTVLEKRVALKLLPVAMSSQSEAVSRFRQEIKAVGKLDDPGLVSASDAGEVDGLHFLAMELVDGADLSRAARWHEESFGQPLAPRLACELVADAARAMASAHTSGLVHRDLKPSNIMLGRDARVRVLDLGLALLNPVQAELRGDEPDDGAGEQDVHAGSAEAGDAEAGNADAAAGGRSSVSDPSTVHTLDDSSFSTPSRNPARQTLLGAVRPTAGGGSPTPLPPQNAPMGAANPASVTATQSVAPSHATSVGQLVGTVDYMAPEQASDTHCVDQRADVYSLGATLYRLIGGHPPYPESRYRSLLKKLVAMATVTPPPLDELRPDCPPAIAELVGRLMDRDPDRRPATMQATVEAIEATLAALPDDPSDEPVSPNDDAAGDTPRDAEDDRSATASGAPPSPVRTVQQLAVSLPPLPRRAVGLSDLPLLARPKLRSKGRSHWTSSAVATPGLPEGEPPGQDRLAAIAEQSAQRQAFEDTMRRTAAPSGPQTWLLAVAGAAVVVLVGWVLSMPSGRDRATDAGDDAKTAAAVDPATSRENGPDAPADMPAGALTTALAFELSNSVLLPEVKLDLNGPATIELFARVDPVEGYEEWSASGRTEPIPVGSDLDMLVDDRNSVMPELLLHRAGLAIRHLRERGIWQAQVYDQDEGRVQFQEFAPARADRGWSHLAVTWDGGEMAFYVDGQRGVPQAISPTRELRSIIQFLSPCCEPIVLGPRDWNNQVTSGFSGSVANVRFSDTVRYDGPFARPDATAGTRPGDDAIAADASPFRLTSPLLFVADADAIGLYQRADMPTDETDAEDPHVATVFPEQTSRAADGLIRGAEWIDLTAPDAGADADTDTDTDVDADPAE